MLALPPALSRWMCARFVLHLCPRTMKNRHDAAQPIITLESMYLMSASSLDADLDPPSSPDVDLSEIDPAVGPLPGLDFPAELIVDPTPDARSNVAFLEAAELPPVVERRVTIDADRLPELAGVAVFAQRVDAAGRVVGDADLVIEQNGKIGVAGTSEAGVFGQIGLNPHTLVSEQIVIEVDGLITGGQFRFTNLFRGEGDRAGGAGHEQGRWEAFSDGKVVASGLFVSDSHHAGTVNLEWPDGVTADRIAFSAAEYSGGQHGSTRDSSDFYLTSVTLDMRESAEPPSDVPLAFGDGPQPATFVEGRGPVTLGAVIADGQQAGDLEGTVLTLHRAGGPQADDVFSARWSDHGSEDQTLEVDGIAIGQILTNDGGRLELLFNAQANSALVNEALGTLGYQHAADHSRGDVDLVWTLTEREGQTTQQLSRVRLIDADRIYVTTAAREVDGDTSSIAALIANAGGTGISLEEAILAANNTDNEGGADEILFDIAGSGVHVLVGGGLPEITDAVTIDAASQTGFVDRPLIVLDGNDAAGHGLTITASADGTEIRGLLIRDFAGHGIAIQAGSEDNTIAGNWIGRLANDGSDAGHEEQNGGAGVFIAGADNYIGGMSASEGNVISGNGQQGIRISGEAADFNVIHGNLIGTDQHGRLDIGNRWAGIRVDNGADDTVIGGTQTGAGNILSGNGTYGVRVTGTGTQDTTIAGNLIGTDDSGTAALGNDINGILVDRGAVGTTIGTAANGAGNVISANGQQGVRVSGAGTDLTVIQGNVIGTNAAGSVVLGNGAAGILIDDGATNTVVGGDQAGAANIVSGNGTHGVRVTGDGTDDSTIAGNLIGTDATGSVALGNEQNGVRIDSGAGGTTVGGTTERAGNVVSGNGTQGVRISGDATDGSVVQGNVIGTDSDGEFAVGNRFAGLLIDTGAAGSIIGGPQTGAENIISGNGTFGVRITGPGTSEHTVQGNLIGLDHTATVAVGNASHGVRLDDGAAGNTIGGDSEAANVIGGNGGDGIRIDGVGTDHNVATDNILPTSAGPNAELANAAQPVFVGPETRDNITDTAADGPADDPSGQHDQHGAHSQDGEQATAEAGPASSAADSERRELIERVISAVSVQLPERYVLRDAVAGSGAAEDSVVLTLGLAGQPDAGQVTMLLPNAQAVASGEVIVDFSGLTLGDVARDVPTFTFDAPTTATAPEPAVRRGSRPDEQTGLVS